MDLALSSDEAAATLLSDEHFASLPAIAAFKQAKKEAEEATSGEEAPSSPCSSPTSGSGCFMADVLVGLMRETRREQDDRGLAVLATEAAAKLVFLQRLADGSAPSLNIPFTSPPDGFIVVFFFSLL